MALPLTEGAPHFIETSVDPTLAEEDNSGLEGGLACAVRKEGKQKMAADKIADKMKLFLRIL
jgi:hypothetical protein